MLCTSLSTLHGGKASRFVHCHHDGVGLSVGVGLALLDLYLWWGKPRLITSQSRPGLVIVSKALAMACLSLVASPLAILPSPSFLFSPLAPLLLQQLAPYCLLILPDHLSTTRLRPVMVLHYLRAWCPTPWIDVITGTTLRLWLQMSAHMSSRFLSSRRSLILHLGPCQAFVNQSFLLF